MAVDRTSTGRIERRERIHALTLRRQFFEKERPIVFGGAADHWKARDRWSGGYLRARYGEMPIPCGDGEVLLSDLFEALDDEMSPHLWGVAVRRMSRELFEDIDDLRGIDRSWFPHPLVPNGWVGRIDPEPELELGGAGSVSPLRREPLGAYRLETQLVGTQRVALLPPEAALALGPMRSVRGGFRSSLPELDRLDFRNYPALGQFRAISVELEPGDTIFVPGCWWHEGKTRSALSVSVARLGVSASNYSRFLRELWQHERDEHFVRGVVAQVVLRLFGVLRRRRSSPPNERIASVS